MDTANEFGMYMTDSDIPYYDDGEQIIIDCEWKDLPNRMEIYEDRVKYLVRLTKRLFFLSDDKLEKINELINKIPVDMLKVAAETINPRSYRLIDWIDTMDLMIPEEYTYNGDMLFSGLVSELNKFIKKD